MNFPPYASKSNLIAKAASFARCDKLQKLYEVIEGKDRVSTRKINRILEDMEEGLKLDAIFLKNIADRLDG